MHTFVTYNSVNTSLYSTTSAQHVCNNFTLVNVSVINQNLAQQMHVGLYNGWTNSISGVNIYGNISVTSSDSSNVVVGLVMSQTFATVSLTNVLIWANITMTSACTSSLVASTISIVSNTLTISTLNLNGSIDGTASPNVSCAFIANSITATATIQAVTILPQVLIASSGNGALLINDVAAGGVANLTTISIGTNNNTVLPSV
jgi:hypothetical protein